MDDHPPEWVSSQWGTGKPSAMAAPVLTASYPVPRDCLQSLFGGVGWGQDLFPQVWLSESLLDAPGLLRDGRRPPEGTGGRLRDAGRLCLGPNPPHPSAILDVAGHHVVRGHRWHPMSPYAGSRERSSGPAIWTTFRGSSPARSGSICLPRSRPISAPCRSATHSTRSLLRTASTSRSGRRSTCTRTRRSSSGSSRR